MKDKKCLLIVPYFGKFNNYYQLFLNSIANLQSFDFLIVTDDKRKFINPQNVTCLYMSFEDHTHKSYVIIGQHTVIFLMTMLKIINTGVSVILIVSMAIWIS